MELSDGSVLPFLRFVSPSVLALFACTNRSFVSDTVPEVRPAVRTSESRKGC